MKEKKQAKKSLFDIYVLDFFRRNAGTLIGLAAMCIVLTLSTDKFLTPNNIINVFRQISINALLTIGITHAILIGGIDLSIGSVLAASGTFCCGFIADGMPVGLALLIGILIGIAFGFVNGYIISRSEIPPFVVTLAMMSVARGFAYIYSGGRPIRSQQEFFNKIGNGYIGSIPVPVIIVLVIAIIASYVLNRTKFGRYIYAVGGNREAAKYSGVDVKNVEMIVYIISGFLAALSGIILAARMYSGQPTVGQGFEMDAIAASVLGGTSFTGGAGTIGGAMIGALIIGVLNNGLNLTKVPFYYQLVIKGIVILLAVFFDLYKKDRSKASK